MKKLIETIKEVLGIKKSVQYKIYMPGEPIPYDDIEDVECEIIN